MYKHWTENLLKNSIFTTLSPIGLVFVSLCPKFFVDHNNIFFSSKSWISYQSTGICVKIEPKILREIFSPQLKSRFESSVKNIKIWSHIWFVQLQSPILCDRASGIQYFKNYWIRSIAHWVIACWRFVYIKTHVSLPSAMPSTSHLNNSMRHRRIFFIFIALDSSHWGLPNSLFRYLSYG